MTAAALPQCAAVDADLTLLEDASAGGPSLCWYRGRGGERVSCALSDVLSVAAQGSALHVHHFPLVQACGGCKFCAWLCERCALLLMRAARGRVRPQEYGCCSSGEATRRAEPQCVQCSSGAEAEAWVARIRGALGPRPRRVAVFVNPVGGTGRALSVYRAQVRRRGSGAGRLHGALG
jgi:hypothetical protein